MTNFHEPDDEPDRTHAAIGSGADDAAVRNDLLAVWLDDEAGGRTRELADYQALFPGRESLVAAELELLAGEADLRLEGAPVIPQLELDGRTGARGQGVVTFDLVYLERDVVVKVLPTSTWPTSCAARFQREAKTLAALRHPNIVVCYQAGRTDTGFGYMVTESVAGSNLREWIAEHGPMDEAVALRVCRDLARALEHALESGIIHRDVKPEIVLLQPKSNAGDALPFDVKLAELGLPHPAAPLLGGAAVARPILVGAVMGSPCAMAPEQFDDPDAVDFRADIYGLGCVLYHAIAGRPAFEANSLTSVIKEKIGRAAPDVRAVQPSTRREVSAFVQSMIAAEPEDRPSSYSEVVTSCEELL